MRLFFKYGFTLAFCVFMLMMFNSCGSRRNMVYFQPDSSQINTFYEQHVPKIQPNDILTIVVTAADPKVTAPFNPLSTMMSSNLTQQTDLALRPTYTVNEKGDITLPMLGEVHISGMTRVQAIEKLRKDLSQYIKDPGVNINFNNFRVSV